MPRSTAEDYDTLTGTLCQALGVRIKDKTECLIYSEAGVLVSRGDLDFLQDGDRVYVEPRGR